MGYMLWEKLQTVNQAGLTCKALLAFWPWWWWGRCDNCFLIASLSYGAQSLHAKCCSVLGCIDAWHATCLVHGASSIRLITPLRTPSHTTSCFWSKDFFNNLLPPQILFALNLPYERGWACQFSWSPELEDLGTRDVGKHLQESVIHPTWL